MFTRSYVLINAILISIVVFTLAGCGASETATSTDSTGAVSANLVWDGAKTSGKIVSSAPAGVATVRISISGPSIATKQQDFPVASGSGTIGSVPPGTGLTVTASGLDASGTITYQGLVGNITVQVGKTTDVGTISMLPIAAALKSIAVTPITPSIAIGVTQQFAATGTYSDSTTKDLSSSVTWSSSSTSVATIASSGISIALASGSTTITATSGAISGTTTFTVTAAPTLQSIAVTPANGTYIVGSTQQFSATGTNYDYSTHNITSLVSWNSSNSSVATIATNGLITAVAAGSTTITATSGTISGTAIITVATHSSSSPIYSYVSSLGSGQLYGPEGIAVDKSGNVYIVDSLNSRVMKYSSNGTYMTQIGSYGTGNGQLKYPAGVAVDSSGNVYVMDVFNYRVVKYNGSGTYITQWGSKGSGNGQFGQFYNASGAIAVDSNANVYIADFGNNRIQKFSSSGAYLTQWGARGSGIGQFYAPSGVAIDSIGNVYVSDAGPIGNIQKFSSSGTFITQWGSAGTGNGQFGTTSGNHSLGIAVDSNDNVYVTDTINCRIQKFDNGGIYITQWGSKGSANGQFTSPYSVAVDSNDNVYVTDVSKNIVQKFIH